MDQDNFKAAKREMRRYVSAAIGRMSAEEQVERSVRAQKRLIEMPQFMESRAVLLYYSLPGEIETCGLISHALSTGKRVALPRTCPETHEMEALQIRDPATDLFCGPYGAKEPRDGLPAIAAGEIDLVAVPGRAFDEHGHRLGRGAGFYDRYLGLSSFRGTTVALAFDCQILDSIPSQEHDVSVQFVITESRTITCASRSGPPARTLFHGA